jgi:Domain of unknown function (DUF397)
VEVAVTDGQVLIRDSGDVTEPPLEFSPYAWLTFVTPVKALDGARLPSPGHVIENFVGLRGQRVAWCVATDPAEVPPHKAAIGNRWYTVYDEADPTGLKLCFTEPEWSAFLAGILGGDFDLDDGDRFLSDNARQ